jgi:hypothetical protein
MKQLVKKISRDLNSSNLNVLTEWAIEEGIRIQQIAAPTFFEDERAAYVAEQF